MVPPILGVWRSFRIKINNCRLLQINCNNKLDYFILGVRNNKTLVNYKFYTQVILEFVDLIQSLASWFYVCDINSFDGNENFNTYDQSVWLLNTYETSPEKKKKKKKKKTQTHTQQFGFPTRSVTNWAVQSQKNDS